MYEHGLGRLIEKFLEQALGRVDQSAGKGPTVTGKRILPYCVGERVELATALFPFAGMNRPHGLGIKASRPASEIIIYCTAQICSYEGGFSQVCTL
jgi:hypothetical protein